jgi:hypothetical protein
MKFNQVIDAKVRLMLSRSPRFQAMLDESRQSIASGKGLSNNEFWKAARRRKR